MEAACDRKTKTLIVKNILLEKDVKLSKTLQADINDCIDRLAKFNGYGRVSWLDNAMIFNANYI
jgi:uncharacterized protein YcaQ